MLSFPIQNYQGYREGKPVSDRLSFISPEPEPLLDKILTDAGVPIPPRVQFKGENFASAGLFQSSLPVEASQAWLSLTSLELFFHPLLAVLAASDG